MTPNALPRPSIRQLALTFVVGPMTSGAVAMEDEWHLHTGGVSHHFQQTRASEREWRQNHPGLGLERRVDHDLDWSVRYAGGIMQDSRSFWGGYTGAAYVREWNVPGVADFGLGLGAYAFYRSVNWSGKMALIPAVLPTASVGLLDNRIGLNLIAVPRVKLHNEAMPAVLYAQVSVRFP